MAESVVVPPQVSWKTAHTITDETKNTVRDLMQLVHSGVAHAYQQLKSNSPEDDEWVSVLENVDRELREDGIVQKPMTVALLGKGGVGKSFICDSLLIQGLSPDSEDVQRLMAMKRSVEGGGKSCTLLPTLFRYGDKLSSFRESQLSGEVEVIEFPSPLLKNFNLQLVDTPGLIPSTGEVDRKATDASISYFKHQLPDAIWVVPSFNNRVPDLNDVVLALRQFLEIGLFTHPDPLFTPTVTYVLNPRHTETDMSDIMRGFPDSIKSAVCYLLNLRRDAIGCGATPEIDTRLRHLLEGDATLQGLKEVANGSGRAYYHIHRLEFIRFQPASKPGLGPQERPRATDLQMEHTLAEFCEVLRNLRNHKTIRRMIVCARRLHRINSGCKLRALDRRNAASKIAQPVPTDVPAHVKPYRDALKTGKSGPPKVPTVSLEQVQVPEANSCAFFEQCLTDVICSRFQELLNRLNAIWQRGEGLAGQLPPLALEPSAQHLMDNLQRLCQRGDKMLSEAFVNKWKGLQLAIKEYCQSEWTPDKPMEELMERFISGSGDRPADETDMPMERLMTQCRDVAQFLVDQVSFQLSFLAQSPQSNSLTETEIIYQLAQRCDHRLRSLGYLEHREFRDDSTDKLRQDMAHRPMALNPKFEKEVQAQRNRSRELQTIPDQSKMFSNVQLQTSETSSISCQVDVEQECITFSLPIELPKEKMFAPNRNIVLVPSQFSSPTENSLPQLFAKEWTEAQPDSPSVIFVVDESQADAYADCLRDTLWSLEHRSGPVLLMRVSASDGWTLNIGRKRQLMKLFMETLLKQGYTINERYVTHSDHLQCLETFNKTGGPIQIALPDAVNFLHRVMDATGEPVDPDEWRKFLRPAMRDDDIMDDDTLYDTLMDNHLRKDLWDGTLLQPSWSYFARRMDQFVSHDGREQMKAQWNTFQGIRNVVGMVSVGNKQTPYLSRQLADILTSDSSMFLGTYTHQSSKDMYHFVLHHILSLEHVNYVDPAEFFALRATCPDLQQGMEKNMAALERGAKRGSYDKAWAKKYGFKHEEQRLVTDAMDKWGRLCMVTPLIVKSMVRIKSSSTGKRRGSTGGDKIQSPAKRARKSTGK